MKQKIARQSVLTPRQIFKQYEKKIANAYRNQQTATHIAVAAIVEIGQIYIEARDYKSSLKLKGSGKLWRQFEEGLPISKASRSKYISIAQNAAMKLKTVQKALPPSVYSLYELSRIPVPDLKQLISTKQIHSEVGRKDITSLLAKVSVSGLPMTIYGHDDHASKAATIPAVPSGGSSIEIMRLKLPMERWESRFNELRDELVRFLDERKVGYVFGKEVTVRQRSEDKYWRAIQNAFFKGLRKSVQEQIRRMVDSQISGSEKSSFVKSFSFKKKVAFLKYGWDEVDVLSAVNEGEVKRFFLDLGLGEEKEWNELVSAKLNEAAASVPQPKHLQHSGDDAKSEVRAFEAAVEAQKKKLPRRDFSGLKVS